MPLCIKIERNMVSFPSSLSLQNLDLGLISVLSSRTRWEGMKNYSRKKSP